MRSMKISRSNNTIDNKRSCSNFEKKLSFLLSKLILTKVLVIVVIINEVIVVLVKK